MDFFVSYQLAKLKNIAIARFVLLKTNEYLWETALFVCGTLLKLT